MSKKRNFRCPDCWRSYPSAEAVMRHQVKAEGRCIDSAPTYVAGRIKHERAKYTEGDKYMSKKCTCSRDGAPSGYYWHDPACPVHNKNE